MSRKEYYCGFCGLVTSDADRINWHDCHPLAYVAVRMKASNLIESPEYLMGLSKVPDVIRDEYGRPLLKIELLAIGLASDPDFMATLEQCVFSGYESFFMDYVRFNLGNWFESLSDLAVGNPWNMAALLKQQSSWTVPDMREAYVPPHKISGIKPNGFIFDEIQTIEIDLEFPRGHVVIRDESDIARAFAPVLRGLQAIETKKTFRDLEFKNGRSKYSATPKKKR